MNNYKLIMQYDGTNYCGWQIQNNGISVQETIVKSIKTILNEDVNLIGSGRTDTGVHALGQVANFKTDQNLDPYKFGYALNSVLPKDISIRNMEIVNELFNSRFDARRRSYLYIISKGKSPFYDKYSYKFFNDIKIDLLNELSQGFYGEKDFTSFCKKESEVENKICNIYNIHWKSTWEFAIFLIEANRFLHGMVRTIIGTLLKVSNSGGVGETIHKIIDSKNRELAGESVPAKGLFLYKVKY
jgi:tRNA pseudouridine38-40 synthase